jgi:enoyl-[acyl-carrier protein] reductase I
MTVQIDLEGKRGIIVGIANNKSIAYGCARVFKQAEADLMVTYQNEKAEPHVMPLAKELSAAFAADFRLYRLLLLHLPGQSDA